MLRSSTQFFEAFQEVMKKSIETCGDTLERMRLLILEGSSCFHFCLKKVEPKKRVNSLLFWWFAESVRISSHTLFLASYGLYRNAFYNIRHLLESLVQSIYIETNHPKCNLNTKLEILKEIEDKKEYRAGRMIEEKPIFAKLKFKRIDCKGLLKDEYSELSKIVHPSHEKIKDTFEDVTKIRGIPAEIKPDEVVRIFDSLRRAYDICYYVIVACYPEIKATLDEKTKMKKFAKKYNMNLLNRIVT